MSGRVPMLPLWLRMALAPPPRMRRGAKPVAVVLILTVGAVMLVWAAMVAGLAFTLEAAL